MTKIKVERRFVGWSRPLVVEAADLLVSRLLESANPRLGLADYILVLPGGRAGRRLVEIIVQASKVSGLANPQVLTPGEVVARVDAVVGAVIEPYRDLKPASPMEELLAWQRAARTLDPDALQAIFGRSMDGLLNAETGALDISIKQATRFNKVKRELNGAALTISEASKILLKASPSQTSERWEALAALWENYQRELLAARLFDTLDARRLALSPQYIGATSEKLRANPENCKSIVLIGCIDLNHLAKSLLGSLNQPLESIIAAPKELQECFDPFGTLIDAASLELSTHFESAVPDHAVCVTRTPTEQGEQVVRQCLERGLAVGDLPSCLTIGILDPEARVYLERALSARGLNLHSGAATRFANTALGKLMQSLKEYLRSGLFQSFAALAGDPLMMNLVLEGAAQDVRAKLDSARVELVPFRVPRGLKGIEPSSEGVSDLLDLEKRLEQVLGALIASGEQELQLLCNGVENLLVKISERLGRDPFSSGLGIQGLHEWECSYQLVIDEITKIFASDRSKQVRFSADQFIELLLELLADSTIPDLGRENEVEALGWLELLHDDAPVLALLGFNEGYVPSPVQGDALLSEGVRRDLGIQSMQARVLRDRYILAALSHSRQLAALTLARWSTTGEPLSPSRLLLSGSPKEIARKILKLNQQSIDSVAPIEPSLRTEKGSWINLEQLRPLIVADRGKLSVSEFESYLRSPLQWLLDRAMRASLDGPLRNRIEKIPEDLYELDAAQYGELAHAILKDGLEGLAEGEVRESEIRAALQAAFESIMLRRFGVNFNRWIAPAVQIQLFRLREQLEFIAKAESAERTKGWFPKYFEIDLGKLKGTALKVAVAGVGEVEVTGRIDRVDFNPSANSWRILDYKTSASSERPRAAHLSSRKAWKNLQLPLYVLALERAGFSGEIISCYFKIGTTQEKTGIDLVTPGWSLEELESAQSEAARLANEMLNPSQVLEAMLRDRSKRVEAEREFILRAKRGVVEP